MTSSVSQDAPADQSLIKSRWPTVELGDVCHVQLGKMLSPKSKTGMRPVPYLRNENVQWNRFDLTDVSWMDFSEAEEEKFRLQPGDLLVCEGGEPGRAAVWEGQIERCCYQKALHRIRPRNEGLFPPFLMYRLWMSAMNGEFAGAQTQTTISHVPREKLLQLRMPLPPLTEQRRIAAELTRALEGVSTVQSVALERLASAESLPAAFLVEVFDGSERSGWEARRLGELVRRHNEVIHPGDRKSGEAIFVGLEHIEPNSGRRIGSGTVDLGNLTGRKPTFRKGQIVYGYLRPYLNKVWVAEFDGCSSVDQFAFDVRSDSADTNFVAAFMRSPTFLQRSHVVTTTGQLPRIGIDEIEAVSVEVPPTVFEQSRIASELTHRLEAAESLIRHCRDELSEIAAIPGSLLRAAFEGDS